MSTWVKARPVLAASLALCALAIGSANCGFSNSSKPGTTGTGGSTTGAAGNGNPQGAAGNGNPQGEAGNGNPQGAAGNGNPQGAAGNGNPQGAAGSTGVAGSTGAAGSTGGSTGAAGVGNVTGTWQNYEVTASLPKAKIAVAQMPGKLKYTKVVIHSQFLAESCSIGDYNGDGVPDVSSGRIWYQGPDFKTQHPFRDGHGVLPSSGAGIELNTGVSDDWADYPWDMDGDGDTDIINIAQCDVPEANPPTGPTGGPNNNPPAAGTPNKIGTVQVHATAYWYENPGKAALAGDPKWTPHLMHPDVRMEQHELVDFNGDGYPEVLGGCRDCGTGDTKGYYQGDPAKPLTMWTYHQVSGHFTFPFGNLGWMHGVGGGDINGDGKADWMDRSGAYLQQADGSFNLTVCTGKNTPAGCGWIQEKTSLLMSGFYDGQPDGQGNKGASHMWAVDMDMDGCSDVVAANWAHGVGLYWYKQGNTGTAAAPVCTYSFTKYQFMGDSQADSAADVTKWGAGFTEPHSLGVYDMDGDGRPDVVAGKMRFAHPMGQGDPDLPGTPYLYVFKNTAAMDARTGSPITLTPNLVDGNPAMAAGTPDGGMGVGRQLAIGHVNTDGIMDICVGTKVGLAVFLGQ